MGLFEYLQRQPFVRENAKPRLATTVKQATLILRRMCGNRNVARMESPVTEPIRTYGRSKRNPKEILRDYPSIARVKTARGIY